MRVRIDQSVIFDINNEEETRKDRDSGGGKNIKDGENYLNSLKN